MKPVPPCAGDAVSDRAQRRIMPALVLKTPCQNGDSEALPLIRALEDRTTGRQSRIPIWNFPIALDLAPEASRRSQSHIEIIGELGSTLACPPSQISFGLRLQPPGDPPKQMRSIKRGRCLFGRKSRASGV